MTKEIKSSLSHEQRSFIRDKENQAVFSEIKAAKDGSAIQDGLSLRAKSSNARTEVELTRDGGVEVSVYYPFDNNTDASDGSLYFVDRMRFNSQGQLLGAEAGQAYGKFFSREILYNGQGDKGFWKERLEYYQNALTSFEQVSADPQNTLDPKQKALYASYALKMGGAYARPFNSKIKKSFQDARLKNISDVDSFLADKGYQVDLSDPKNSYLYIPRRTQGGAELVELCVVVAVKSSDPEVPGRAYLRESFIFSPSDPSRLLGFKRSLEADSANPLVGDVDPWLADVESLHVFDSTGERVLVPELQTSLQVAVPLYTALRQVFPWTPDFHQQSVDGSQAIWEASAVDPSKVKVDVARMGFDQDRLLLGRSIPVVSLNLEDRLAALIPVNSQNGEPIFEAVGMSSERMAQKGQRLSDELQALVQGASEEQQMQMIESFMAGQGNEISGDFFQDLLPYFKVLFGAVEDEFEVGFENLNLSFTVETEGESTRLHLFYTFGGQDFEGEGEGRLVFQESFLFQQKDCVGIQRKVQIYGDDPSGRLTEVRGRIQNLIDSRAFELSGISEEGDEAAVDQWVFAQRLGPVLAPHLNRYQGILPPLLVPEALIQKVQRAEQELTRIQQAAENKKNQQASEGEGVQGGELEEFELEEPDGASSNGGESVDADLEGQFAIQKQVYEEYSGRLKDSLQALQEAQVKDPDIGGKLLVLQKIESELLPDLYREGMDVEFRNDLLSILEALQYGQEEWALQSLDKLLTQEQQSVQGIRQRLSELDGSAAGVEQLNPMEGVLVKNLQEQVSALRGADKTAAADPQKEKSVGEAKVALSRHQDRLYLIVALRSCYQGKIEDSMDAVRRIGSPVFRSVLDRHLAPLERKALVLEGLEASVYVLNEQIYISASEGSRKIGGWEVDVDGDLALIDSILVDAKQVLGGADFHTPLELLQALKDYRVDPDTKLPVLSDEQGGSNLSFPPLLSEKELAFLNQKIIPAFHGDLALRAINAAAQQPVREKRARSYFRIARGHLAKTERFASAGLIVQNIVAPKLPNVPSQDAVEVFGTLIAQTEQPRQAVEFREIQNKFLAPLEALEILSQPAPAEEPQTPPPGLGAAQLELAKAGKVLAGEEEWSGASSLSPEESRLFAEASRQYRWLASLEKGFEVGSSDSKGKVVFGLAVDATQEPSSSLRHIKDGAQLLLQVNSQIVQRERELASQGEAPLSQEQQQKILEDLLKGVSWEAQQVCSWLMGDEGLQSFFQVLVQNYAQGDFSANVKRLGSALSEGQRKHFQRQFKELAPSGKWPGDPQERVALLFSILVTLPDSKTSLSQLQSFAANLKTGLALQQAKSQMRVATEETMRNLAEKQEIRQMALGEVFRQAGHEAMGHQNEGLKELLARVSVVPLILRVRDKEGWAGVAARFSDSEDGKVGTLKFWAQKATSWIPNLKGDGQAEIAEKAAEEIIVLRQELLNSPWIEALDAITAEPDSVQRHHSYRALMVGVMLRKEFFSVAMEMPNLSVEQRQRAFVDIEKNIKALEDAMGQLDKLARIEDYSERKNFELSFGQETAALVNQVMMLDPQLLELVKSYPEEEQRLKVLDAVKSQVDVLKSQVETLRTLANAKEPQEMRSTLTTLLEHKDFKGIEYVTPLLSELLNRLEMGEFAAIRPQDQIGAQSDEELKMYLSSQVPDHDFSASVHEFLAYTAGQGSLATRIEMGAPSFLKAISSPTSLAAYSTMGLAGMGARGLVMAKWGHLLGTGGRSAMALRVATPTTELFAEGTALTFSTASLESLFHSSQGQWDDLGFKTSKNIVTLGVLRGSQRLWSRGVGEPMANGRLGSRLGAPIEGVRGEAVVADVAGVLHRANPVGLAEGQIGQLTRLGERVNQLGNHAAGIGGMWGVEVVSGEIQGSDVSPWDHLGHAFTGYVQTTIGYGLARAITGGRVHSAFHQMAVGMEQSARARASTRPVPVVEGAEVAAPARETAGGKAEALPTLQLFHRDGAFYVTPEIFFKARLEGPQSVPEFIESKGGEVVGAQWKESSDGLTVSFPLESNATIKPEIPLRIVGKNALSHNQDYTLSNGDIFYYGGKRYVVAEDSATGEVRVCSMELSPFELAAEGMIPGMSVRNLPTGGVRLFFEASAEAGELPVFVNGNRLARGQDYELNPGDVVEITNGGAYRLSTSVESMSQPLRDEMAQLSPAEQASLAGVLRRADPERGFDTLGRHLAWYPGKGSELLRAFFKGAVEQRLPLEAYPEELGVREAARKIFESEVQSLKRQGYLGENTPGSEFLPIEQQFYLGYGVRVTTSKVAAAKNFTELHDAFASLPRGIDSIGGVSRSSLEGVLRVRSLEEKIAEAEKREAETSTPSEELQAMKDELAALQEVVAPDVKFPQSLGLAQRVADLQEAKKYEVERVASSHPEGQELKDLLVRVVQLQMMGRRARRRDNGDYNQAQRLARAAIDGLTSQGRRLLLQSGDPRVGAALLGAYFGPEGKRELPTAYDGYRIAAYMGQVGIGEPIQLRVVEQSEGLPSRVILFRGENSSGWPMLRTLPQGSSVTELFPSSETLNQWISYAQNEILSGEGGAAPHRQVLQDGRFQYSTSTVSPHGVVETNLTFSASGELQSVGLRHSVYPSSARAPELSGLLGDLGKLSFSQSGFNMKIESVDHPYSFTPTPPMEFVSPREVERAVVAGWGMINAVTSLFRSVGSPPTAGPDAGLVQGAATAAGQPPSEAVDANPSARP